jgi:hypothetical protein
MKLSPRYRMRFRISEKLRDASVADTFLAARYSAGCSRTSSSGGFLVVLFGTL